MTVVNIQVADQRAIVASDTLLYNFDASVALDASGNAQHKTKVLALPHAGLVLSSRGSSRLLATLFELQHRLVDFDQACATLRGGLLRSCGELAHLRDPARWQYPRDSLHVTGWSDSLQNMACASFSTQDGFETFEESIAYADRPGSSSGFAGPAMARDAHRIPRDAESMFASVRGQVDRARAENPHAPYGGDCVVAEVTRHAITLRNMGSLGLPEPKATTAEPAEGFMQIQTEAATAIISGSLQAGPFNGASGVITDASVTVNNTYGTSVRLLVRIFGDYSAANGTGSALVARSNFGLNDSVTAGVAAGNTRIVRAQVPAGETFAIPLTATAEFTLAAGNSITVGVFFSDHASATADGFLSNVRTVVEIIKR